MTACTITTVTDTPGMAALTPAWAALWQRSPAATPFQSPAWQLAWWAQFGTERPVLACLWNGDTLAGLLPAYVLDEGGGKLLPIGIGISDTLDVLLAPEAPPDAASRLLAAALQEAGPIARADWPDVPPGSPLLRAAAPPGWQAQWRQGTPCPVLVLHGARLREAIPAAAHRKLRMNRNRAERAGGTTLHLAGADDWRPMLETVCRLHAARWTAQGEPGGVLADPRVGACLHAATGPLLAAGALRLAALHVGGTPAAACLALLAGPDRLLLYLGGFDAGFAALSPGSLLLDALARHAMHEGRRELHFLRGGEAYKYAWGAVDRFNADLALLPA